MKLIASGAWVQIKFKGPVGERDVTSADIIIPLATQCSFDEDWRIQEANVLGYLGPVTLDTQGYSCSITIGAFLTEDPAKLVSSGLTGVSATGKSLYDLMPYRANVQTLGMGRRFESVTIINLANNYAITFNDVVIASNGMQASPNAYVGANMRLMAKERVVNPAAS